MSDSTRFELYRDTDGKWRWRFVHRNGNILADSGEGYSRKTDAKQGIETIKQHGPEAPVEETEE